MNNEKSISMKFTNSVTGVKKIENYRERLLQLKETMESLPKSSIINADISTSLNKANNLLIQLNKNVSNVKGSTSNMNNGFKNTGNQLDNLNGKFKTAFNFSAFVGFAKMFGRFVTNLSRFTSKSADYVENLNLMNVAFHRTEDSISDASTEGIRFVNTISEMYGLDESNMIRTVGIFKQLANAMNLSDEVGTKLSETLAQMSIDVSSLYNVDFEKASEVLQSALAGQTKPIRGLTGADITESTLQVTLDTYGIDTTVRDLSYVEKRLIIVTSLIDQLKESQNDYGRTIESVSNQMRVFNEQVSRLGRAIGNTLLPVLSKILPYLNAVLMVLTEIFSWVAGLLGFKEDDYAGFAGISDSALQIEDSLGKADSNAKKLKQSLREFDKLNVITTPKDSDKNSGIGTISPKVLKAFNDATASYEKRLENIKMRATEIRDNIMEWLGFTKVVDEKTGDVSFKFDHITGGTVLGALAVGGIIYKGINTIYKILKKVGLLKFPLVSNLFSGLGGLFGNSKLKNAKGAVSATTEISQSAKSFQIPDVKTILKGIADIGLIVLGAIALMEIVGLISKIPNVKEVASSGIELTKQIFNGIASFAIPLAGLSIAVKAMGSVGVGTFAKGLAGFATVVAGTDAVIIALGALVSIPYFKDFASTGIELTKRVFKGLWDVAIPLGAMTAYLLLLGLASPVAILSGLAGFALVVGGVSSVLVAIGALRQIEGFDWLVQEGGELLLKLGDILGGFAGSIVSGFMDKATEGLADVGTHLSDFMINATPFFEKINAVNSDSVQAVAYLSESILLLTASNVLDGLTAWFTGGTSLEEFGKDIANFAPYIVKYSNTVKDLDNSVVENSVKSANTLSAFAKNLPNQGGIISWFTGDNKLSDFSKVLPQFGKDLKAYSTNVKGLDSSVVINSTDSAKTLSEFAKNLPNQGGIISWFTGDNKLNDFSKILPQFGKDLKAYSDNIKGLNGEVITNSANSAIALSELANNLPNKGGIVSWFTGDNKLSDFGADLSKFGSKFKEYYDEIKNIDTSKINNVSNALLNLVNGLKEIKNYGLTSTLKDFAKQLSSSSSGISKAFSTSDANTIGKNFGEKLAKAMSTAFKNNFSAKIKIVDGKTTLKNLKISSYATGGLPPVGQLFVANEKGPELVGQIGGQSFVANQNQMLNLLDKNLSNSQSKSFNPTFIIQVGDKEVARKVLNDLQDMASSNGKPIVIGG